MEMWVRIDSNKNEMTVKVLNSGLVVSVFEF